MGGDVICDVVADGAAEVTVDAASVVAGGDGDTVGTEEMDGDRLSGDEAADSERRSGSGVWGVGLGGFLLLTLRSSGCSLPVASAVSIDSIAKDFGSGEVFCW